MTACCRCDVEHDDDQMVWVENLHPDVDQYVTRMCRDCTRYAGRWPYGNVIEGDSFNPLLIINKALGFVSPEATGDES